MPTTVIESSKRPTVVGMKLSGKSRVKRVARNDDLGDRDRPKAKNPTHAVERLKKRWGIED